MKRTTRRTQELRKRTPCHVANGSSRQARKPVLNQLSHSSNLACTPLVSAASKAAARSFEPCTASAAVFFACTTFWFLHVDYLIEELGFQVDCEFSDFLAFSSARSRSISCWRNARSAAVSTEGRHHHARSREAMRVVDAARPSVSGEAEVVGAAM